MKAILIVDDLAMVRELLSRTLQECGFKCTTVSSGEEALTAAHIHQPDLILLDVKMPDFDGFSVLKALRNDSKTASIPVIMLTLDADKEDVMVATRLGAKDYILKSQFSVSSLLERITLQLSGNSERHAGSTHLGEAVPPSRTPAIPAGSLPTPTVPSGIEPQGTTERPEQLLKKLTPLLTRAELVKRLAVCKDLKMMSPSVSRLMEMMNSSACPIDTIAGAIQQDQAVAVKVLKLANSAVFFRGGPVDSVLKAVMRIGIQQIRQTVMSLGVINRFGSGGALSNLSLPQFWEHSIACGLIASMITRRRGAKGADAAFTMGLLHDLGRLVFIEALGEQYSQVLALASELHLPLELVESRLLSMNHAEASEVVLQAWHFPTEMIAPIAMHHLPIASLRRKATNSFHEACTMTLANRLAHALLLGSSGNDAIYPTDEFVEALDLAPEAIAQIERDIPPQTQEIKIAMLARSSQESWPAHRDEVLHKMSIPLHPIYVSSRHGGYSCRIVFDQLRHCAVDGKPNLGVVYVQEPGEKSALLQKVHEAEGKAGVDSLPLLVVSPDGQLAVEWGMPENRKVRFILPTFMLSTLSDTVDQLITSPTN